jgi:hypothetical protein
MAYEVLRVRSVGAVVKTLRGDALKAYEAAVTSLKGEGCRGGGKRLAAQGGGDYPLCQRSLYGQWRLTTAYRGDGSIVLIALSEHTKTRR